LLLRNFSTSYDDNCLVLQTFGIFSAKSRVKGFLEIYHAYIREPNTGSTDEEETTPAEGEPGWEMIDGVQTAAGTVETPAQVGIFWITSQCRDNLHAIVFRLLRFPIKSKSCLFLLDGKKDKMPTAGPISSITMQGLRNGSGLYRKQQLIFLRLLIINNVRATGMAPL
jgi:hypothetical protein